MNKSLNKIYEGTLSYLFTKFPDKFLNYALAPKDNSLNVVFKVVDQHDELKQVFQILRPFYQNFDYHKPMTSKLRSMTHLLLPSTKIIIMKQGDVVIGCLSLFTNSAAPLPVHKLLKITNISDDESKVCELSSFHMRKGYKHLFRKTIVPFGIFVHEYLVDVLKVEHVAFSVRKDESKVLSKILEINNYNGPLRDRSFSDAEVPQLMCVDLKGLENRLAEKYDKRPSDKNLYLFVKENRKNYSHNNKSIAPALVSRKDQFKEFISLENSIFSDLVDSEKKYLEVFFNYSTADSFEQHYDLLGQSKFVK